MRSQIVRALILRLQESDDLLPGGMANGRKVNDMTLPVDMTFGGNARLIAMLLGNRHRSEDPWQHEWGAARGG